MGWMRQVKIDQQHQCDVYKEMGSVQAPKDHKNIRTHFFFDVKHNGRCNARLVADGYLTNVPPSSFYSGIGQLSSSPT